MDIANFANKVVGVSIITGRGDNGETDLLFGHRVSKSSQRIKTLGVIDELNAALGIARASGSREEWITIIDTVQEKLVGLMGQMATLPEDYPRYRESGFPLIDGEDVDWILEEARGFEAAGVRFKGWARPGEEGCQARAAIDFARTIARKAEREILILHESGESVPEEVRLYLNKLSDLLWILARVEG